MFKDSRVREEEKKEEFRVDKAHCIGRNIERESPHPNRALQKDKIAERK